MGHQFCASGLRAMAFSMGILFLSVITTGTAKAGPDGGNDSLQGMQMAEADAREVNVSTFSGNNSSSGMQVQSIRVAPATAPTLATQPDFNSFAAQPGVNIQVLTTQPDQNLQIHSQPGGGGTAPALATQTTANQPSVQQPATPTPNVGSPTAGGAVEPVGSGGNANEPPTAGLGSGPQFGEPGGSAPGDDSATRQTSLPDLPGPAAPAMTSLPPEMTSLPPVEPISPPTDEDSLIDGTAKLGFVRKGKSERSKIGNAYETHPRSNASGGGVIGFGDEEMSADDSTEYAPLLEKESGKKLRQFGRAEIADAESMYGVASADQAGSLADTSAEDDALAGILAELDADIAMRENLLRDYQEHGGASLQAQLESDPNLERLFSGPELEAIKAGRELTIIDAEPAALQEEDQAPVGKSYSFLFERHGITRVEYARAKARGLANRSAAAVDGQFGSRRSLFEMVGARYKMYSTQFKSIDQVLNDFGRRK